VRDGEGKKYVRYRLLATMPLGALAGFALGFGQSKAIEAFLPPLIGFGLMSLSMVSAWWLSRRTRPMEFKCDADAAKVGLGLELASGLEKLTRFMGQPSDWIGTDRFLITHPSLVERTARLIDASRSFGE
jgi:Zn-dependent protease with chaperone function